MTPWALRMGYAMPVGGKNRRPGGRRITKGRNPSVFPQALPCLEQEKRTVRIFPPIR